MSAPKTAAPTPEPCPCCGSVARNVFEEGAWHYVLCENRKCGAQSGIFPTKPMALKAWNTRAAPAPQGDAPTQIVPTEPTPDMRIAGVGAWHAATATAETYVDNADACYKAMLAAAPRSHSDAGPCVYEDGKSCVLEDNEIGPCLCANPVRRPRSDAGSGTAPSRIEIITALKSANHNFMATGVDRESDERYDDMADSMSNLFRSASPPPVGREVLELANTFEQRIEGIKSYPGLLRFDISVKDVRTIVAALSPKEG